MHPKKKDSVPIPCGSTAAPTAGCNSSPIRRAGTCLIGETDVHAHGLNAGTGHLGSDSKRDGPHHACATDEGTEAGDLLSGGHEGGSQTLVLVGEILDFCLELGQPRFFALSALESGCNNRGVVNTW